MNDTHYRGWNISYNPDAPISSRYRATRFGVGMNAATVLAVQGMIDTKVTDEQLKLNKSTREVKLSLAIPQRCQNGHGFYRESGTQTQCPYCLMRKMTDLTDRLATIQALAYQIVETIK